MVTYIYVSFSSVNQYKEKKKIMKNMVILREAQIQQVAEDKGPLMQQLHQVLNERKKLKMQLQYATLDVHFLNRHFDHVWHKEIPNNNLESNEATAILKAERCCIIGCICMQ